MALPIWAAMGAPGAQGKPLGGLLPKPPEMPPPPSPDEANKAAAELRRRRVAARGYASTILSRDLVNPMGLKEKLGQ